MAEKSKEELLDEFGRAAYSGKRDEAWNARAAVLARMCGPGEVVVKLPPGYQMGADGQIEKTARPNGGNDDTAA